MGRSQRDEGHGEDILGYPAGGLVKVISASGVGFDSDGILPSKPQSPDLHPTILELVQVLLLLTTDMSSSISSCSFSAAGEDQHLPNGGVLISPCIGDQLALSSALLSSFSGQDLMARQLHGRHVL
jgi:hypothetical protein